MNRKKAEKLLAALIFDELDERSRAELAAYLETDDELRERLVDMRMAAKVVSDALHHGPEPALSKRRLERLAKLAARGKTRPALPIPARLAAAAAIVIGVALLGLIMPALNTTRRVAPPMRLLSGEDHQASNFYADEPRRPLSAELPSTGPVRNTRVYAYDRVDSSKEHRRPGINIVTENDTILDYTPDGSVEPLALSITDTTNVTGAGEASSAVDKLARLSSARRSSELEPGGASYGWKLGGALSGGDVSETLPPENTVTLYSKAVRPVQWNEPLERDGDRSAGADGTVTLGDGEAPAIKPYVPEGPYTRPHEPTAPQTVAKYVEASERFEAAGPVAKAGEDKPGKAEVHQWHEQADTPTVDFKAGTRRGDAAGGPHRVGAGSSGGYGGGYGGYSGYAGYGRGVYDGRYGGAVDSFGENSGAEILGRPDEAERRDRSAGLGAYKPTTTQGSLLPGLSLKNGGEVSQKAPPPGRTSGPAGKASPTGLDRGSRSEIMEEELAEPRKADSRAKQLERRASDRPAVPPTDEASVFEYRTRKQAQAKEMGESAKSLDEKKPPSPPTQPKTESAPEAKTRTARELQHQEVSKEVLAQRDSESMIRQKPKTPAADSPESFDASEAVRGAEAETKLEVVDMPGRAHIGLGSKGQSIATGVESRPRTQLRPDRGREGTSVTARSGPEDAKDLGELPPASRFKLMPVNPWVLTERDPFSTFALDVDTASYTLCRRYIRDGFLPPPGAVRMEEFINYFNYNYPRRTGRTFAVYAEAAPSPFAAKGQDLTLLKVAVKAKTLGRDQKRPAHLVFVVDSSASMDQPDRLGLVQQALGALVDKLSPADRVSLVTFAERAHLHLEDVSARESDRIRQAIEAIQPAGPTNLLAGLKLGYDTARRAFDPKRINHVILCSDGVANVGQTEAEAVLNEVAKDRKQGITITCVGAGYGSYNDAFLEALANRGDGSYVFLDSPAQVRSAFVKQLTANMQAVAKDARIQVQFNPKRVRRYRLIGYENRDIKDELFRDDTIDAGEVGSGQCSTALYELELTGAGRARLHDDRLATVFVRYRNAQTGYIEEISSPVSTAVIRRLTVEDAPRFYLAACAGRFAEVLRGSEHARDADLSELLRLAEKVSLALPLDRDVRELAELIRMSRHLPEAR